MAANGYGPAPVTGHIGRIPNYGRTQVNPMGSVEPPACIQNAMMTKDKKPFTYTPGGLDLSQIKTPSMARRMARQRSLEEHEQAYNQQQADRGYHHHQPTGGPAPPPPPPPIPAPPPPPALLIEVPKSKSPKPPAPGERPEIVIPENPIGMLRKTHSPYHWEAEKAELAKVGPVPKYMEKVPSPLTVQMPPSTFSQHPPQTYNPPNNSQRQNYQPGNKGNNTPESPIHRPEAQYAHQKSSPTGNISTPTRETLVRQDSQFNKSPQPFSGQSPASNGSLYSPSPNNNWKQPERRDSPSSNPQTPLINRGPITPNSQQYSPNFQNKNLQGYTENSFHTLPRVSQRNQDNVSNRVNNNTIFNNVQPQSPKADDSNSTPWRSNNLNRYQREPESQQNSNNQQQTYSPPWKTIDKNNNSNKQQQAYSPPWKTIDNNNNSKTESNYSPPWKQENKSFVVNQHQPLQTQPQQQEKQQYIPPWIRSSQESNDNTSAPWRSQDNNNQRTAIPNSSICSQNQEPPRYQSTISIPVTPKSRNTQPEQTSTPPQKEVVYVNQEPVYYCPDSPKSLPPWVKTQKEKEKTKTPPPVWCQRPLDGRTSAPRELATPPKDSNQEPEWVKKSNEMRGVREVVSPPKYQQPVQANWSARPSDNKRVDNTSSSQGSRVIPIQMELGSSDKQGNQSQLRLVIDMQPNGNNQTQYSQPTQRIMRVLSPQLVRLDDGSQQYEIPTLNRTFQNQENQSKERIIPIQIEGGNGGASKRVFYHKFTQEVPPRQSKAFKVLQIITGTQDGDDIQDMEYRHGYTDV